MAMDIVNAFLDLVLPPSALLFLLFSYPVIAFFQFWSIAIRFVSPENVHGKVVLITGASSGIGEHIAYQYAKQGARLVLVARRDDLLKEVADRARRVGSPHVHTIRADVTKEDECLRFVNETISQFGRMDHLVLNAGVAHSFFFEEAQDTAAMKQVWDTTFWGVLYSVFHALPHLKRAQGKIVVIDSTAAWLPFPRMSIYNAAKAAVLQLFDTLRVELGTKVSITIVQPGATESEMTKGRAVTADGRLEMLPDDVRDTQFGPMPVAYAETVAKAAVHAARRRYRYVIVPLWYSTFLLYRVLVPEFLFYFLRKLYATKVDHRYASRATLDASGVKSALYPPSIIKTNVE